MKSNNLDFGVGTVYGSDELATLLGDDWFQQDCAIPATPVCSRVADRYTVNSVIFLFFLVDASFECILICFQIFTLFLQKNYEILTI